MEIEESASRVSIGFPLGLALLVALLLFFCCFFCCCLHWEKLQSLLRLSGLVINPRAQLQADITYSQQKPAFPIMKKKQNQAQSLPVVMPGDEVPKFMAIACPCQPPMDERITIRVQKAAPSDFCSGT